MHGDFRGCGDFCCGYPERGRSHTVNELVVVFIAALVEEEPRHAAVVLLRHRTHPPGAHHVNEAGTFEHLEVVSDGALRHLEQPGQLAGGGRPLSQEGDDPAPHLVAESTELSRFGDQERVRGVVVEESR